MANKSKAQGSYSIQVNIHLRGEDARCFERYMKQIDERKKSEAAYKAIIGQMRAAGIKAA